MATLIQIRRGTSSQWSSANPVLASGELAISTDLEKIKIGDGTSTWSALSYINATPSELNDIVDGAPATLDTLNKLAASLGDDADFSTTVTTALGNKLDTSTASSTYLTQANAATTYDVAGSASTVAGNLSSHESDTTSVHGISDTSNLVYTNDARLTDERVPTDNSVT